MKAWPEHGAARAGLHNVVSAMVEHELDQGNARAAESLLAELESPPEHLRDRISSTLRSSEVKQRRMESLAAMGREMDLGIGQKTRVVVAVVLGVFWTLLPLPSALFPHIRSFGLSFSGMLMMVGAQLVLLIGLALWARTTMSRTAVNRAVLGAAFVATGAQAAFLFGCMVSGTEPRTTFALLQVLPFTILAVLAATLFHGLWPSAIAYLIAFGFASWDLVAGYWAVSAAGLVITANVVVLWRPRTPTLQEMERVSKVPVQRFRV